MQIETHTKDTRSLVAMYFPGSISLAICLSLGLNPPLSFSLSIYFFVSTYLSVSLSLILPLPSLYQFLPSLSSPTLSLLLLSHSPPPLLLSLLLSHSPPPPPLPHHSISQAVLLEATAV